MLGVEQDEELDDEEHDAELNDEERDVEQSDGEHDVAHHPHEVHEVQAFFYIFYLKRKYSDFF